MKTPVFLMLSKDQVTFIDYAAKIMVLATKKPVKRSDIIKYLMKHGFSVFESYINKLRKELEEKKTGKKLKRKKNLTLIQ